MKYITLAVTEGVIREVMAGNYFQKQLAIQGASPELRALIQDATEQLRITANINGVFELSVGDNGAIWGSHQSQGRQFDDFENLYALLARRPNLPVTFWWE